MAWKLILFAASLAAATPIVGSTPDADLRVKAPPASASARYCIKVAAITGTRLETILCRTRDEWADWDIDIDEVWAKDGVRVIDA